MSSPLPTKFDSGSQDGYSAGSSRVNREERRCFPQKQIELVVMQPVSGVRDFHEAAIPDGLCKGILYRHRQKTFQSPEKQNGTRDPAQEFDRILDIVAVRREYARVIVEFPD